MCIREKRLSTCLADLEKGFAAEDIRVALPPRLLLTPLPAGGCLHALSRLLFPANPEGAATNAEAPGVNAPAANAATARPADSAGVDFIPVVLCVKSKSGGKRRPPSPRRNFTSTERRGE